MEPTAGELLAAVTNDAIDRKAYDFESPVRVKMVVA